MVSHIISRVVVVAVGTLYPAYRSFKAIKTKNVREYVKWMMYWVVFACFLAVETVADILVSWFIPFYYEIKILFVIWLLWPVTKGSSILYRKFVHPYLISNEKDIDRYLASAADRGLDVMRRFSRSGVQMAANTMLQSDIVTRGQQLVQAYAKVTIPAMESGEVQGGNEDTVDTARTQTGDQASVPDIAIIEPDIENLDPFELDPLSDTRTIAAVCDPPPPYSPPYNPSQQRECAVKPTRKDLAKVQDSDCSPQRRRQPKPTHRGRTTATTQKSVTRASTATRKTTGSSSQS